MDLPVTREELDCIDRVINKGRLENKVKPEDWLANNLRSLINQCSDSELRDKLNELGKLNEDEINFVRERRALLNDGIV